MNTTESCQYQYNRIILNHQRSLDRSIVAHCRRTTNDLSKQRLLSLSRPFLSKRHLSRNDLFHDLSLSLSLFKSISNISPLSDLSLIYPSLSLFLFISLQTTSLHNTYRMKPVRWVTGALKGNGLQKQYMHISSTASSLSPPHIMWSREA